MEIPPLSPRSRIALDTYEVFGSDDEEFDSEESRVSTFGESLPSPLNASNFDAAQSLAATDGSARGSPFSGRSVSSSSSTNFDESSNPIENATWQRHLLSPVHVPVLQEIRTLLSSNAPMSSRHSETRDVSSDEDNDEQRRVWRRLGHEQKMKRKFSPTQGGSTAKRSCDAPGGSKDRQKEAGADAQKEEEAEEQKVATCSVCLEEIDDGGDHRLVALKCGHPFGESCVKKWLENVKECCPLCNRRAKARDIRVVFLDCCRVGSSYELSEARKEATDLRKASAQQNMALRDYDLQLRALKCENDRLHDRIRTLERGLLSAPFAGAAAQTSSKQTFPSTYSFTRLSGQCKYMAYAEYLNLVGVSMKPSSGLFDGYGVELCSLYDLKSRKSKILHRQEIKDLSFHTSRSWLLTASLDNTARISDVVNMNLNNVHSVQLDSKVWSCCWSQANDTNFFLGLANGNINEYDIRQPSEPIHVVRSPTYRKPIASVKSFEINTVGCRASGIISPQQRNSIRLYKEDPGDEMGYTAQDIPVSGYCFSLFYDKDTSSLLVSSRAQNHQSVMNEIWKLSVQRNEITANLRSTFRSGGCASIISKPILCQSPSEETWACCLDDRGKSIQVYSCTDSTLRLTLETQDPNHEQMTQVEKIKLPARSRFALLGLSLNGFSIYY